MDWNEWPDGTPLDIGLAARHILLSMGRRLVEFGDRDRPMMIATPALHDAMVTDICEILAGLDHHRTESLRFLKGELMRMHHLTPAPPIIMVLKK